MLLIQKMGSLCSKHHHYNEADLEENAQAAEIERRIAQDTKAEKHIQKILLLGAGESGKSTIFKQIKLLFQTGFDEAELNSYVSVIHANVYQTIKLLHDGSKEFLHNGTDSLKYDLSDENKEIGEKISEIGSRLSYPPLTKHLAQDIEKLLMDPTIQMTKSLCTTLIRVVMECLVNFLTKQVGERTCQWFGPHRWNGLGSSFPTPFQLQIPYLSCILLIFLLPSESTRIVDVRSLTHCSKPYDGNTCYFRSTLFVVAIRAC